MISQGIPKLRNILTYISEVFVISQEIPKLRNILTYFREVFVTSQEIPKLLFNLITLDRCFWYDKGFQKFDTF